MSRGKDCAYSDIDARAERSCAASDRYRNRIAPDADWIDTAGAARLLSVTVHTLATLSPQLGQVARRKTRSSRGAGPRGNGWLWRRADLERVVMTRRECRVQIRVALRVLAALDEGRLLTESLPATAEGGPAAAAA